MSDSGAILTFLAARRDARVPSSDGSPTPPVTRTIVGTMPPASPLLTSIDPDGWLAAFVQGLGILAAWILASGALLMVFGEL